MYISSGEGSFGYTQHRHCLGDDCSLGIHPECFASLGLLKRSHLHLEEDDCKRWLGSHEMCTEITERGIFLTILHPKRQRLIWAVCQILYSDPINYSLKTMFMFDL